MNDTPQSELPPDQQPAAEYNPSPETEVVDVDEALYPLRLQLVGLAAACLLLSLAFSALVYKQSKSVQATLSDRNTRIEQLRRTEQEIGPLLNQLASYSVNKPELMAIFSRYGLPVSTTNPAPPKP